MKLLGAAFALGLLVLVIWFTVQTNRPGPDVGEMDGLAILRLMDGEISPPEYCQRRGLSHAPGGASDAAEKAMARLAANYQNSAPGFQDGVRRAFFAVPPVRQREYDQAQKFIAALQKNRSLVMEPSYRAQLVIISEFLGRQCLQLASVTR